MSNPGAVVSREIAHGERAEAELDSFISRRHEQRRKSGPEREAEEAWKESERREKTRRTADNRAAWHGWHLDQAERHRRTLAALVAHHEGEAQKLMQPERRRTA